MQCFFCLLTDLHSKIFERLNKQKSRDLDFICAEDSSQCQNSYPKGQVESLKLNIQVQHVLGVRGKKKSQAIFPITAEHLLMLLLCVFQACKHGNRHYPHIISGCPCTPTHSHLGLFSSLDGNPQVISPLSSRLLAGPQRVLSFKEHRLHISSLWQHLFLYSTEGSLFP